MIVATCTSVHRHQGLTGMEDMRAVDFHLADDQVIHALADASFSVLASVVAPGARGPTLRQPWPLITDRDDATELSRGLAEITATQGVDLVVTPWCARRVEAAAEILRPRWLVSIGNFHDDQPRDDLMDDLALDFRYSIQIVPAPGIGRLILVADRLATPDIRIRAEAMTARAAILDVLRCLVDRPCRVCSFRDLATWRQVA